MVTRPFPFPCGFDMCFMLLAGWRFAPAGLRCAPFYNNRDSLPQLVLSQPPTEGNACSGGKVLALTTALLTPRLRAHTFLSPDSLDESFGSPWPGLWRRFFL